MRNKSFAEILSEEMAAAAFGKTYDEQDSPPNPAFHNTLKTFAFNSAWDHTLDNVVQKNAAASARKAYGEPPQLQVTYQWSSQAQIAITRLKQLGVDCNSEGSMEELRRSYRRALKRFHPDILARQKGAREAHNLFINIKELFEICLRSPPERRIEKRETF